MELKEKLLFSYIDKRKYLTILFQERLIDSVEYYASNNDLTIKIKELKKELNW